MLWKDIIDLAILHKQMTVSEISAKKWFNEGKKWLSYEYDTACNKFTTVYEVVNAPHTYELDPKCLRIKSVTDEGKNEMYYSADDTTITFNNNGIYSVVWLLEPSDFTGQTASPSIRTQFCPALAKYIASRELADYKPAKSGSLFSEFLSNAASVDRRLKRMSRTINPRPVPKFR